MPIPDLILRATHDACAWYQVGRFFRQVGDPACACAALRQALMLDSGHGPSLLALGNLMFDCGRFDLALEYFDRFGRMPET
jgi:tetratricopeptide (TPR) repeat protein